MGQRRPAAAQRQPKRAGNIKKAHGHGLRGISRGTSAAELRFCSWKSWTRSLYPHSPFGLVARVSATHKRDQTVEGPE